MAGSWANVTLPDFLSDYFMWSFLLESFSIKNEPFLPAHAQETNGTYNPSFACPLNYSRILFFQFVKIRFLFYLFRFVLSFLFQLVLTTRQTCFHLCHGLQKWYPHTARKMGCVVLLVICIENFSCLISWYNSISHLFQWPQFCKFLS